MKKSLVALILFSSVGLSMPVFAADPSLHEVYQAADAGKLEDAQRMMREVLRDHPDSGKAHYVEAELLAKQGHSKQAANELATAEKLSPGLPFANAQSVSSLRQAINRHVPDDVSPVPHTAVVQPTHESSFPWGMLLVGLGVMAFIAWAARFMASRNPQSGTGPMQPDLGSYRPAYSSSSYGGAPQGYAASSAAQTGGSGLGSQVLGGLATGAAVGAGVVAGEALMHHFMDGHKAEAGSGQRFSSFDGISDLPSTPLNDMGGNDFGISDSTSWDDSGSTGDSDWN
jgi:uncharacterized protein